MAMEEPNETVGRPALRALECFVAGLTNQQGLNNSGDLRIIADTKGLFNTVQEACNLVHLGF